MTTKELIFAEIKRLIRDKNLCSTTERRVGGHTALLKLLAFLDTLPDEPVPDCHDLKEAAKEYDEEHMIENGCGVCHNIYEVTAEDAFKAGAEWQKRKMMEGAVDGYVNYYEDSGGILMAEAQVRCPYHNGDKVRIIIIPKEVER